MERTPLFFMSRCESTVQPEILLDREPHLWTGLAQPMSSYTWSSSTQGLRIASPPLSAHHLIDLLTNFLWLPDSSQMSPNLLYFLCPGDKQHWVVSSDHLPWVVLFIPPCLPQVCDHILRKNMACAQLIIIIHITLLAWHFASLSFNTSCTSVHESL